ncbi:tyrosine-type recombinase/integrase [Paralimibaculum aggregatum]|nr:tyrosine-type recombinase/integrase [Limibaculum sp. NKW23]
MLRSHVALPRRLEERAASRPPRSRALEMEIAVAIAILLVCPIRRRNLAEIRIDRHLQRQKDGRVWLVFGADEVKNRQPIEFALHPPVVALIDRHLTGHRPVLVPGGTPWLFPRRDGAAPCAKGALSARISRTIRRELGLEIHMHLFRHLAAMLWLEAHPGNDEAARRLLGHAALSSTLNAYAGF